MATATKPLATIMTHEVTAVIEDRGGNMGVVRVKCASAWDALDAVVSQLSTEYDMTYEDVMNCWTLTAMTVMRKEN